MKELTTTLKVEEIDRTKGEARCFADDGDYIEQVFVPLFLLPKRVKAGQRFELYAKEVHYAGV